MNKHLIITISDDIDVFDSIEAAESYCEPWILEPEHNFRVFDQDGNIFKASIVQKKGKCLFGLLNRNFESLHLEPSGEKNVERLRSEILNYLDQSLNKEKGQYTDLNLGQLVEVLLKQRGLTG